MTLLARQKALIRFVNDEDFEALVRRAPELAANESGADISYLHLLAALPRQRLHAFRASQRVKALRRAGGRTSDT